MNETHAAQSTSTTTAKPKRGRPDIKKVLFGAFILALIAAAVGTGFLYYRTRQELKRLSTQQGQEELAKREIQAVVNELKKLTLLPDEEPVLATILDAPYLATQSAFYEKSQNGDKLVVYPKAQKAYIYSPERRLIVNAGPLIVDQGQTEPVKVEIRNGSSSVGAGTRLKSQIDGNGVQVTEVGDAANKNYNQTLVIAINKSITTEQLTPFAQNIGGRVTSSLPSGEAASDADVLIIVGGSAPAASPAPQQ